MRCSLVLLVSALVLCGCSGNVEQALEETTAQLEALNQRIAALEAHGVAAEPKGESNAAPIVAATSSSVMTNQDLVVSPEMAAMVAEQVNAIVMARLEAKVDERIATQVGTADDIEAIFSEVVEEEIDAREDAVRREREAQRRKQAAEWDARGISRRTSAAGLDEGKQQAVAAARATMRGELDLQLPQLKEQGATAAEMMVAVAERRTQYESELLDIMSDEEIQAYYEADRWVQRDQGRLEELSKSLALDEPQFQKVVDAYSARRNTMTDGFMLVSGGYIEHGDIRQGMEQTQSQLNASMKEVLTAEQFTTFEASGGADVGRGWGRRRGR